MNKLLKTTILSNTATTNKIHFQGINGLRGLGALVVIIYHIKQFFPVVGITKIGGNAKGTPIAGVVFFFVLSGFLITYILLTEKERLGQIAISKFYIRRVLRIWPAYYVSVAFSCLLVVLGLVPITAPFSTTFTLYLVFLANIGYSLGYVVPTLGPLWSVGVEEQFYIIWPILIHYSKNILKAIVLFLGGYLLLKCLARGLNMTGLYHILVNSSFSALSIGALGAWALKENKTHFLAICRHNMTHILAWGIVWYSIFIKPFHIVSLIDNEIYALLFLIIILNSNANKYIIKFLDNIIFNFLGVLSYGLYVYHLPLIYVLGLMLKPWIVSIDSLIIQIIAVYGLIVPCVVAWAWLSYRYFERFFLNIKKKYAVIYHHS